MNSETTEHELKVLLIGTCDISKAFFEMVLQKFSLDDVYVPNTGKSWRVFSRIFGDQKFRVYVQDSFSGTKLSDLGPKQLWNWESAVIVFDCDLSQNLLELKKGLNSILQESKVFLVVVGIVFNLEIRDVIFEEAAELCKEFNVIYTELDLTTKDFSFEILEILIRAKFSSILKTN